MDGNQEKKHPGLSTRRPLRAVIDAISERTGPIRCAGVEGSQAAYAAGRIHSATGGPTVVVVPSVRAAETVADDLRFFAQDPASEILTFPVYNILPFKMVSYHNETAARRIRTLYRLTAAERPPLLVISAEGLLCRLIPRHEITEFVELVMAGEEIDREGFVRKLVSGGYTRAAIVEEPGDFSVRGGVLDVFTPLYEAPLRMELFGDMVESLRFFSPNTQRTLRRVDEAVVLPAREVILRMTEIDPVIQRVRQAALLADVPVERVRELVERIQENGIFPGIEGLAPLIHSGADTLFDYLPDDTLFLLQEPDAVKDAMAAFSDRVADGYAEGRKAGRLVLRPDDLYLSPEAVTAALADRNPVSLSPLAVTGPDAGVSFYLSAAPAADLTLELKQSRNSEQPFGPLANWIRTRIEALDRVVLAINQRRGARRLRQILAGYGIEAAETEENAFPGLDGRGRVHLLPGPLSGGMLWPDEQVAVMTDTEILGAGRQTARRGSRPVPPSELLAVEDLKQGEFVVHVDHGIGRYDGLVKLELDGGTNDFLLIRYRDEDRLYLPVDRMNTIQKYLGVEGMGPTLDKMGGRTWEKVKARVKRSVEQIAGELLKLYAARKVRGGHAFGEPDGAFAGLVSDFPYEETPDQRRAIEAVIADMQAPTPMDRLVCGDVGYGKTEVALRAAFLAINEGKQVAVLVPTTVLAEQHYATFSARFDRYPVNVACLSRFRSAAEQRSIVKGLGDGGIDIVIGTHRLIQKDVVFRDLGLLVLDEEQRFGVKHKERLKALRETVDVLTLTATPIPRTLHLSMTGVRDISVISTPPEDRHPIITYVCAFEDAIVAEAIRKELARGGQIYFVHNNIHGIETMAARLKELVPEVRLEVAHGRMGEDELESVMFRFLARELDMLVCTTIIESGLDVPAANTILVNRADRFGLAQMYQLRGRVGRADEQAYAYLFIPEESTLTRNAQKRLKVLMEHSDLGSGFQIAMSDLRIRGGGTILGASQSGHIAAVGYDMFLKLMENAVAELKGQPVIEDLEPEIHIDLSAYIAEEYIPDIDQRLTAYRRLARMRELKEIADFKEELADRFGPLPPEAANLLLKIMLRVLCIRAGVRRLDLAETRMGLQFSEAHQRRPMGIVDLALAGAKQGMRLTPDGTLQVDLAAAGGSGRPLQRAKNILKQISQRVNN